jgi:rhodanese-related sulfurtransferase
MTAQGYEGDVNPAEAWEMLATQPGTVLVDVRTVDEWNRVGVPDTTETGTPPVFVEWNRATGHNANFIEELRAQGVTSGPVLFICRSGQRSMGAARAATAAGIGPAYNVTQGFEGGIDPSGRRGTTGWKAAGLPWRQS